MFPTYQTILCCHGLGPRAPDVLRHAFGLARAYGGKVVVVHSEEPVNPQIQRMLRRHLPSDTMRKAREDLRRESFDEISRQVREIPDGAGTTNLREVRVVEGAPAETLLEVAREVGADLIVMGAHRHTTIGELLLGSTAHRVAQRAPVPVFLVRLTE
jgi:nucleotide-binding universal stress UspA family protein